MCTCVKEKKAAGEGEIKQLNKREGGTWIKGVAGEERMSERKRNTMAAIVNCNH